MNKKTWKEGLTKNIQKLKCLLPFFVPSIFLKMNLFTYFLLTHSTLHVYLSESEAQLFIYLWFSI